MHNREFSVHQATECTIHSTTVLSCPHPHHLVRADRLHMILGEHMTRLFRNLEEGTAPNQLRVSTHYQARTFIQTMKTMIWMQHQRPKRLSVLNSSAPTAVAREPLTRLLPTRVDADKMKIRHELVADSSRGPMSTGESDRSIYHKS